MHRLVMIIPATASLNLLAQSAHAACASLPLSFTAMHDWGFTEGRMTLRFTHDASGKVTGIRIDNYDTGSSQSQDPTGPVTNLTDHGGGRYTFTSSTEYTYDITVGANCEFKGGSAKGYHSEAGEVRVSFRSG